MKCTHPLYLLPTSHNRTSSRMLLTFSDLSEFLYSIWSDSCAFFALAVSCLPHSGIAESSSRTVVADVVTLSLGADKMLKPCGSIGRHSGTIVHFSRTSSRFVSSRWLMVLVCVAVHKQPMLQHSWSAEGFIRWQRERRHSTQSRWIEQIICGALSRLNRATRRVHPISLRFNWLTLVQQCRMPTTKLKRKRRVWMRQHKKEQPNRKQIRNWVCFSVGFNGRETARAHARLSDRT